MTVENNYTIIIINLLCVVVGVLEGFIFLTSIVKIMGVAYL